MKNNVEYLLFGNKNDILNIFLKTPYYQINNYNKNIIDIYFTHNLLIRYFSKYNFYKFLEENKINWSKIISKKLRINDLIFLINNKVKTLFIIKVMFGKSYYNIYKKLQTCDFKRKQFLKLVTPLGLRVEYVYVLSDWFKKPEYKDVLDYIQSVNCHYIFNEIPLLWLGLPTK